MIKQTFLTLALASLLFWFLAVPAAAQGRYYSPPFTSTTPQSTVPTGQPTGALRSCQAREAAVKTRLSHLIDLATNIETKFDTIASRVETYYTQKVVPSGKTVPNYNDQVTDIKTQKTTVAAAIGKAQSDAASFSCATGDPKSLLNQFRLDMQAVKTDLKNYRQSVRNLIVAVRSVVGTGEPGK